MIEQDLFIRLWVVYTIFSFITFIVLVIWILTNKDYSDEGKFKYIPFDDEENGVWFKIKKEATPKN